MNRSRCRLPSILNTRRQFLTECRTVPDSAWRDSKRRLEKALRAVGRDPAYPTPTDYGSLSLARRSRTRRMSCAAKLAD